MSSDVGAAKGLRGGLTRLLRALTDTDQRDGSRTTPSGPGQVRRLRVQLAAALGAEGPGRRADAIAELDKALQESGDQPSDGAIHLLAGQLAQSTDPLAALRSYLTAVEQPDVRDQAIRHARLLIESGSEGQQAVAGLSTDDVQRLTGLADTDEGQLRLLTARVLRERGEDEAALELLRNGAAERGPRRLEILTDTAELLLDLGRPDEVLALADEDDARWSLAAARARLLQGDYDAVLATVDQHGARWGPSVDLTDLQVLALVGRDSIDEAVGTLQGPAPPSRPAQVVVALAARWSDTARTAASENLRAKPSDPSAVLLDVQVELESLGRQPFDPDRPPAAEQYENARSLLTAVTAGLTASPERLWWMRVQDVVRAHDGSYQFFAWQLRECRDEPVTDNQLRAIDLSRTSYLQDAVIYERLASIASHEADPAAAAEAYEQAGASWGYDPVRDYESSLRCAEAAYRHGPNQTRASTLTFAVLADSYRSQEIEPLLERIEGTLVLARNHLGEPEGLVRLTTALAMLLGRRFECAPRDRFRLGYEAVPWLLAACQLTPLDAELQSLLAVVLRAVGHVDAGLQFALRGMAAEATASSVSTVAICRADHGDYEIVNELVANEALAAETVWVESMRSAVRLYSGTLDDRRLSEPDSTAPAWAFTHVALSEVLLSGFEATRARVEAVFDQMSEGDFSADELALSFVPHRGFGPAETLQRMQAVGNLGPGDLRLCEVLTDWLTDSRSTVESLVQQVQESVSRLSDFDAFQHCYGPIVLAARDGNDRPGQLILPAGLREACRDRLAAEAETWIDRLDDISPGLSAILRLTDPELPATVVMNACQAAASAMAGSDLAPVVAPLIEQATERAAEQLVQSCFQWRLGRGTPDPAGVALALASDSDVPVSRQVAVLVSAEGAGTALLERLTGSSPDEQSEAARIIGVAARAAVQNAPELWVLHDQLLDGWNDDGPAGTLRRLIHDELTSVLAPLLGSGPPEERQPLSYVVLVIGDDFVPEDTSENWTLFKDLLPAMKQRVRERTGYVMPGVLVRADDRFDSSLWVQINAATVAAQRLPTDGWVAVCTPAEATGRDPLTGRPVVWRKSEPRDVESWTALEYMVRWVERVMTDNVKNLLNMYDVLWALEGADAAVKNKLLASAPLLAGALDLLRTCADDGTLRDQDAIGRRLTAFVADSTARMRRVPA